MRIVMGVVPSDVLHCCLIEPGVGTSKRISCGQEVSPAKCRASFYRSAICTWCARVVHQNNALPAKGIAEIRTAKEFVQCSRHQYADDVRFLGFK